MLVVANELAVRIGGQGGLAGAGRPKKMAESPFSPMLAEQCMGNTPSLGMSSS